MKPAASANCNFDDNKTGTPQVLEFGYDEMNRLVSIGGTGSASFVYDGDGQRVKGTLGGVTTVYVEEYYEVSGSAVTKYYEAGGSRVALRTTGGVRYLLGDHLGSTSVTADGSGGNVSRQLYKAWGETRGTGRVATEYGYTGQYGYEDDFGLLFYRTRWYDPALGRWSQPDNIIPNLYNPLDWDRYLYARANPLKFSDPSGHECYEVGSQKICTADSDSYEELGMIYAPQQYKLSLAEKILGTFHGECDSNCANYVSTVLHSYGLPLDVNNTKFHFWKPDCVNERWSNSAFLFDYLVNDLGFKAGSLPYEAEYDIILPEGTPIFYNDGSYKSGYALNFEQTYRFIHVAVVVGQRQDKNGYTIPLVVDVDNTFVTGKHFYNLTSQMLVI